MWYYTVFKVVVFFALSLVLLTVLEYLTYNFVFFLANCALRVVAFETKFASLNLAHSFVICSEGSFREGCHRELVHSPSYLQRVLDLGRVLLLLTARPLEAADSRR